MRHYLTRIGTWQAHPAAFVIVVAYGIGWATLGDFTWEAGAALATWTMTLFIQRAEHRDTQAIQAKLDEVIHALGGARNELTQVDDAEPEEIEQHRKANNRGDA